MKISELKGGIETITPGPRLGHFIIDLFIIEILSYLIGLIPLVEFTGLIHLLLFPTYYILFEYYKQWTPGKYITNSIVIDDYGGKPDIQTIILRTFIRFVPFEPFSCMDNRSRGWHDRWTKTYVVKKENLNLIHEQLGINLDDKNIESTPSKHKKTLLIGFILFIVGISVYYIIQEINFAINFSHEKVITELNEKDYEMIQGYWDSDWKIYKSLNFKNNNSLVAINQKGDSLELNYIINVRTLTVSDNSGLKLEYFILELNEDKLILRDIETMKDNIEFVKR